MGRLIWLFQFLLYFIQYQLVCSSSLTSFPSSSPTTHHLCRPDQRSALLQFKHMFTINISASSYRDDWGMISSYPKTEFWNESATVDCCSWDGVTCDGSEGHVIGLDLSCSQLYGTIHPNSSLFQLSHLDRLNLAFNDFNYSHIPSAIGKFASLTHLNLSSSYFAGPIPSQITHLSKMISLSLSACRLIFDAVNFKMLLKNQTQLQELHLFGVIINSDLPNSLMNLTSLTFLGLGETGLRGKLPDNIFQLPNLQTLLLDGNGNLTGNLPKVNWSSTSYLRELVIASTSLSGELHDSVCNMSSLQILVMPHNYLNGVIPPCLGNVSNSLHMLDLHMNSFHGAIPTTFAMGNQLRNLNLNGNHLEGPLSQSLANCRFMEVLDLGNNKLNGTFPHWLESLPTLKVLVLHSNGFHGPIICASTTNFPFPNIQVFDVSHNEFSGLLPERYFGGFEAMRNVDESKMKLEYMQYHGFLYSVELVIKGVNFELNILTVLTTIDFSHNKFKGEIPNIIGSLQGLRWLNLSQNSLTGHIPPSLANLTLLESLDLSSNQLSGKIPGQLNRLTFLAVLNLSRNHLVGPIPQGQQFNTFGKESYVENWGLCGFPLSKGCGNSEAPHILHQEDNADFLTGFTWEVVLMGYGCGMTLGLVMGGIMLVTGRPKWFVGIVEREQFRKVKWIKLVGYRQ